MRLFPLPTFAIAIDKSTQYSFKQGMTSQNENKQQTLRQAISNAVQGELQVKWMYAQPSTWTCKAAIYFHYLCLKLAFPLFGTNLFNHSIQLGAVFGILAVQICQPN